MENWQFSHDSNAFEVFIARAVQDDLTIYNFITAKFQWNFGGMVFFFLIYFFMTTNCIVRNSNIFKTAACQTAMT